MAESHPRVRAYVKNDNLGFEAPYRFGSEARRYRPDFIVLVDDGRGVEDPLHLVVEVKGYRREDAKEKKAAMDTFWVPGVNRLGTFGRWAFAEFGDVYEMQEDFGARVEAAFDGLIERGPGVTGRGGGRSPIRRAAAIDSVLLIRQSARRMLFKSTTCSMAGYMRQARRHGSELRSSSPTASRMIPLAILPDRVPSLPAGWPMPLQRSRLVSSCRFQDSLPRILLPGRALILL